MFRLRTGYCISGAFIGMFLLVSFITSLPDGKLHIIFCDVGQGDAAYIRFPDGRDMVIDGGPNDAVLGCLGTHMPFYDRSIDIVALTHPQKDHLNGLITILSSYRVSHVIRSDVVNETDGFSLFRSLIAQKHIHETLAVAGNSVSVGSTVLSVRWPSQTQIAKMKPVSGDIRQSDVLGVSQSAGDLNDASVVLHLRYGSFDVLFPGDADSHVDSLLVSRSLGLSDAVDVLKVPHHGAKTGMTDGFLRWVYPTKNQQVQCQSGDDTKYGKEGGHCPLAIISVGKNSYGHPASETLSRLQENGVTVLRTDKTGDIEVITDGKTWIVRTTGRKKK